MAPRLQLQSLLRNLNQVPGEEPDPELDIQVYFQAPPNTGMNYPCIIYRRDRSDTTFADNIPYRYKKRYQITVIDRDPDSVIPDKVAQLPMCTSERHFVVDNLNHDVFNIYF